MRQAQRAIEMKGENLVTLASCSSSPCLHLPVKCQKFHEFCRLGKRVFLISPFLM